MLPLVTPTSQIVGTQSVINVLTGERYGNITRETAGVLKGEYGTTPAPLNHELQARVLNGSEAITGRPADLIGDELDRLSQELNAVAADKKIELSDEPVDDVLTFALFAQTALKFLENRGNPAAFEPPPGEAAVMPQVESKGVDPAPSSTSVYNVRVNGRAFTVEVSEEGALTGVRSSSENTGDSKPVMDASGVAIPAALAGSIFKVLVKVGDVVNEGQPVLILEAMKMETEIAATTGGTVTAIHVQEGDAVGVGEPLLSIG